MFMGGGGGATPVIPIFLHIMLQDKLFWKVLKIIIINPEAAMHVVNVNCYILKHILTGAQSAVTVIYIPSCAHNYFLILPFQQNSTDSSAIPDKNANNHYANKYQGTFSNITNEEF